MTPDYAQLALNTIQLYQSSLEHAHVAHPKDVRQGPPTRAADDLNALNTPLDPFGEPFWPGTLVGKLESDVRGEEGLYNIVLLRHPRTPYSFVLSTKDPHPSSEPARAPFYIHAHRLLRAMEEALAVNGSRGVAVYDKGVDAGDEEGGRKRFTFFFFDKEENHLDKATLLPGTPSPLPPPDKLTPDLPALLAQVLPSADESYNVVLTSDQLVVFAREQGQGGLVNGERVDGGSILGF